MAEYDVDAPTSHSIAKADPREPTSEAVERVARALCITDGTDPDQLNGVVGVAWKLYVEDARVAIGAIREPNEAMLRASGAALKAYIESLPPEERARKRSWRGYEVSNREKTAARWRAMIDAALGDNPR